MELLTTGLAGSHFGFQASSFFDAEAPSITQLMLLFGPARFSSGFLEHAETVFAAMQEQPCVGLPGERRYGLRREGRGPITLPSALVAALEARAEVGLRR